MMIDCCKYDDDDDDNDDDDGGGGSSDESGKSDDDDDDDDDFKWIAMESMVGGHLRQMKDNLYSYISWSCHSSK